MTLPRGPAVVPLLLVALAYAPSLGNGWAWDDHQLLAANPALSSVSGVLLRDVWGPVNGPTSDLYRPLVMATHAVGQALLPGPGIEHVVNLALHLLIVTCVARIAIHLGATQRAAWVGAAVFGVHAGASEAVFWVTGRHDLVPCALVFAGWLALLEGRAWLAGALLALAPFGKEPFLLTPLLVVAWAVARHKVDRPALALSLGGAAAYYLARVALGFPLPVGAAGANPLGPIGAGAARFAELLFVPASAAVTAPYVASPALGAAVLVGCVVLGALTWRVPRLVAIAAPLLIWLPTTLAAAQIGIVADRYAYALFAGTAILLATGLDRLGRAAWLIPVALVPITISRGFDWATDATLFGADLRVDPTNPHAAFHVAWDLHLRQGNCAAATPLYRLALDAEPRAATNLQSCLADAGDWPAVVELGPRTTTAAGAMNTARAYAQLGDLQHTGAWARIATEREPTDPATWVLFAKALANAQRWPEAVDALDHALALNPADANVAALRAKAAGQLGSPVPIATPSPD